MRQALRRVVLCGFGLLSIGLILFGLWRSQPAEVDVSAVESALPAPASSRASPPTINRPKVVISPAPPSKIAIPELDFSLDVVTETLSEMAPAYNQNHPGERVKEAFYATDFYKAAWASDYGGKAGMSSKNTMYLTCHSSAIRDLPCNVLAPEGVVQQGYHLVVTTERARVTYVIQKLRLIIKKELESDLEVRKVQPGWVVLTVCMLQGERRTQYAWAIFAQAVKEEKR